ncbi:MAG: DUF309 domain-containing protein [Actinomycetota bacterium]|nr:DUF309 domain-containing protein [Actinomycetota bacterium]
MSDQPRDRYGRPLRGSLDHAVEGIPECEDISSSQAWAQALDYLARDLPFHAHESFEQRWRCCPPEERLAWQALAQWGAAVTQLARGNPKGAKANAQKSLASLDSAPLIPAPVDAQAVRAALAELLG